MEGPHLKFTIVGIEGIWYEEDSDEKSPRVKLIQSSIGWVCLLEY